jgi:anti-anti-sigma factor
MNPSSPIALEQIDQTAVVRIVGELDYLSLNDLTHVLQQVGKNERVIMSLENASYLDSIVLHSIIEAAGRFKQNRRQMVIIEPHDDTLKRLLELTGVSLRIKSYPDVAAALGDLGVSKEASWDGIERRKVQLPPPDAAAP